jgi:hypothetical protein
VRCVADSRVDIDLTGYEGIEERHATVTHDFTAGVFTIQCDAHWAPIYVNAREVRRGAEPCPLRPMCVHAVPCHAVLYIRR